MIYSGVLSIDYWGLSFNLVGDGEDMELCGEKSSGKAPAYEVYYGTSLFILSSKLSLLKGEERNKNLSLVFSGCINNLLSFLYAICIA